MTSDLKKKKMYLSHFIEETYTQVGHALSPGLRASSQQGKMRPKSRWPSRVLGHWDVLPSPTGELDKAELGHAVAGARWP